MDEDDLVATTSDNYISSSEDRSKSSRWGTMIEVPLLLVMFGITMADPPITNIIMYRTCVHSLEYPIGECSPFLQPGATNISQDIEVAVQKYSTFVLTVKSVLESLLPAILLLFMVSWSDRHGRKPLLIWPMLALTVSSMMVMGYSMLESFGPWWFIVTCVPYALTGKINIMMVAAICYVTDITDEQKRSFKIMVVQTVFSVGMAVGAVASPHILQAVGVVYLLLIATSILTLACVYTVLFIKESVSNAVPGSILTVMDVSLVKELFRECFKERPNNLRAQILLVVIASSLGTFTLYGGSGLIYLYLRKILDWSLQDFTQFLSVTIAISSVGGFLGIGVIQRLLPIGDLAFAIIAIVSVAAQSFIQAFAVYGWEIYMAAAVAVFGGVASPLMRAFVSKTLPPEDIAKVFGLMSAIDGVCPILAPMLYNAIYAGTLTVFPGAIFVMTGSINVVCVVLLGVVAYLKWNGSSNYVLLEAET